MELRHKYLCQGAPYHIHIFADSYEIFNSFKIPIPATSNKLSNTKERITSKAKDMGRIAKHPHSDPNPECGSLLPVELWWYGLETLPCN